MKVTEAQLEAMCSMAEEAGAAIMQIYASEFTAEFKADESPLTAADLKADEIIRMRIGEQFPGIFILSEESITNEHDDPETFFLVDPLDGTKEFINRNGEFTVNIALIYHGKPVAGVVFAPALAELYFAASGQGAWKRKVNSTVRITCYVSDQRRTLRITGSRSHACADTVKWVNMLTCPYEFIATGSSLKFCKIAEGDVDIYPRLAPTSQWDTAAGHCVLIEAGGSVTDLHGRHLTYGMDRPIINESFLAMSNSRLITSLTGGSL